MKTNESKAEIKKKPEDTYASAIEFWNILGAIKNKGISIDNLISLTKLRECLKNILKEYNEIHKALMEKFDIKPGEDERYNFSDHPEKAQISKEIKELLAKEVSITPSKFLTAKELAACTEGASLDVIGVIFDKLLKES